MLTTDFQFDVNNYTNCNEQYPPNYQSQLSGEGIQIVVDHHDHMDQLQLQCKYRHGQPIPDSHSTIRVWNGLPMSVINQNSQ